MIRFELSNSQHFPPIKLLGKTKTLWVMHTNETLAEINNREAGEGKLELRCSSMGSRNRDYQKQEIKNRGAGEGEARGGERER